MAHDDLARHACRVLEKYTKHEIVVVFDVAGAVDDGVEEVPDRNCVWTHGADVPDRFIGRDEGTCTQEKERKRCETVLFDG